MKEVLLIKFGELAMKGLNRRTFEDILVKNLRRGLSDIGKFEIKNAQSTLTVIPVEEEVDLEAAADRASKVFGIAALSRACVVEKDMDAISQAAGEYLREELEDSTTFKVEAKRSDKKFPLTSPQICMQVGEALLQQFPHLSVDVHHPELTVTVEIRDFGAYIRGGVIHGAGGMPVGTGGRAGVLISGGIDSPVAAWMMAKRGVELVPVHFASPPYTSERAEEKVAQLLRKVSLYAGHMTMYVVPFTEIQEQLKEKCPEELFTILMRRFMMRIAQRIAVRTNCQALVTGESLGQVASQTIHAIACTDQASDLPVFRPLIGMDKEEIVTVARKIDTFETSILPYEDCCTVFTPKHPRTRPILKYVQQAEEAVDGEVLIERALAHVRKRYIGGRPAV